MELEQIAFPALLRAARATFGAAIREALTEIGCDDLPRNGAFVLGALVREGAPLADVIAHLHLSKQAAGALVDTLVNRHYLERTVDPDDRRRLRVALTPRGAETARVIRQASDDVEAELVARVGADYVAHTRAALAALIATG
jgi:DNA-binding MarR family transcriptional regulator